MCGTNGAQKSALGEEQQIAAAMQNSLATEFADNFSVLKELQGSLEPIVNGGENQYGFNAAEDTAKRTQISQLASQGGADTLGVERSAATSGNQTVPAGAQNAINAEVALKSMQQNAQGQNATTVAGYDTGRSNFFSAAQNLAAAPGELENPVAGAAKVATGAAGQYASGANQATQISRAWEGDLAGAVGSVAAGAVKGTAGNNGDSTTTDDSDNPLGVATPSEQGIETTEPDFSSSLDGLGPNAGNGEEE